MSKLNFDDLMSLKVGDKLYEYGYGLEIELTVNRSPEIDDSGKYASVECKSKSGDLFTYGINKDYQHYGPNIYKYKAYTSN